MKEFAIITLLFINATLLVTAARHAAKNAAEICVAYEVEQQKQVLREAGFRE